MASADILSSFSSVLIENTKRYFEAAVNDNAPLARGDVLPIEEGTGTNHTFLAADRARSSTTLALDGAARPKPVARTPKKGTVLPSQVTTTLSFGRLAMLAKLSDGEMGQLLDFNLKMGASDGAATIERALHGLNVNPQASATWTGTGSTDTVTVAFEDISPFEPNALCDFIDASASKSYRIRVTAVTAAAEGSSSANVAGTVSFKNDVANPDGTGVASLTDTSVTTSDTFRPPGYAAGFGGATTKTTDIVSFDDICGSGATASLHGIATSDVASWVGYRLNLNAPYTQEASLGFMQLLLQRGGAYPNIAIVGPQVAAAHAAAAGIRGTGFGHVAAPAVDASVERTIDTKMDKYGNLESARMEMNGAKVIVSPLAPSTKIRLCNDQFTKLLRWTEIGPEPDSSGAPYHVDQANMGVLVFVSGDLTAFTERRPANGEIYGITNL
jgi:hypothetical protein